MDVFDLQAKISLDSKTYKEGLVEASKETSSVGEKLKSGFETISKIGVAAFAAVSSAAVGASAAVLKGVDAYTTAGDRIDKMSQKMGMSAQAYQEWDAIMQHSGTSIDSLQASMKTLANAVENENEAFERLGITQGEIASMNNEQLFSKTITALQNVENETERTYLAGQLLGRGATELGALLNTSAEDTEKMRQRVHELGGVMSDEAVKASAKYKDSIQDLKTAIAGIGRGVIADFVPALTQVSEGLTDVFSGDELGADKVIEGINAAIDSLGKSGNRLKPVLKKLGDIVAKTMPQIISTVGQALVKAAPKLLTATGTVMKELFKNFANADLGIFDWVKEDAVRIVDSVKDAFKGLDLDKIKSSLSNLGNSLNNAFERVGNGLAWASENIISPLIEWAGNEVLPKVFDTLASSVDLLSTAFDFLKEPAKKAWEALKPFAEGTLDVIAGTIDLVSKAVGGLAKEFEGVDWSGYWDDINNGEFFADWKSGFEDILDWVDKHEEDIKDFFDVSDIGKGWREFWEDVGGSAYETQERWTTAFELLKYGVSSFVDAWKVGKDTIVSAIETVKKTFEDFVEAWKTGWKTLTGLGDKAHDATENTLGGALLDTIISKLPAFGTGGKVTQPTLAVVGEKEPEYIIPESKVDDVYPRNGGSIHVDKIEFIVNGSFDIGSPEDRRKLIEELSSDLQNLSIAEQRALGGAGWR